MKYASASLALVLLFLLIVVPVVEAQELPLVTLTGNPNFQAITPSKAVGDLPLVTITGNLGFQATTPPVVPRAVPLVTFTSGVGPFTPLVADRDLPVVAMTGDIGLHPLLTLPEVTVVAAPAILGDATNANLALVMEFAQTRNMNLFAEDAQLVDMPRLETLLGRSEIDKFMTEYYGDYGLFRDVREVALWMSAPSADMVVCESVFYGTARQRDGSILKALRDPITVEVPMMTVFEINNGQIVSERLYYDVSQLLVPLDLH